jgi:hypothetical protein
MLLLRKIIFTVFVLIYLILCPLIVARMLGFVINPLTHRLVKTGLIYVSTTPSNATVYIDGRLAHQKTPTTLRDLTPGKHFIRIGLEGYDDWERNIPVVGKKATVISSILLIPREWPIRTISMQAYKNIFLAGDDILIAVNPLLRDTGVFRDLGSTRYEASSSADIEENLFSPYSIYADGKLIRLYNAPPSPFVLLEALIKDKHKYIWVNLKENPPIIEDISDLFPGQPARLVWNDADNENIFAFYPGDSTRPPYVYRINIKGKAIYPAGELPRAVNQPSAAYQGEKFLINDKNDLLFRQGHRILVYPKENFGAPRVYDIASSRPSTNMCFEEKNGELFFVDDATGTLRAARILTYHPMLNIPMAENQK